MPFKRILIAVDFSPNSVEAFRVAVELARVNTASLHLLHVIEAQPAVPAEIAAEIMQKANTAVEQLVASSFIEAVNLTSEIANGRAFDEIITRSREWRADLIVLGAKGTTSLEEIILGGTAEQVIKETPCSVLIVRPEKRS